MNALVLGKGKSAQAAEIVLRDGNRTVEFADGMDLVVASPGVRVVSELQLGCEQLKSLGVKLLAITGSKGKSSVVKLIADALNRAGIRSVACGNYGRPVCDVASSVARHAEDLAWAVVEVSSFQLETTHLPPGTFEAAAVLNLQEDHLDRHGSIEVYHELKLGLLKMAKVGLDPDCLQRLAAKGDISRLFAGSYFDNDILRANGAAGVAMLRLAGLDDAAISDAFENFVPLEHRMQCVGTFGGVRCVDDSKATSIAALMAGVEMALSPVRLIAGGRAKGDDPKLALGVLTKHVKKVYIIGECAEEFSSAWSDAVDCEICGTLDKAVESAMREAAKDECLLLSPGTASFDQFNSFEERGVAFARLVKIEGQKKK